MLHLVGTNLTEKLRIQLKLDFLTAVVGFWVFFSPIRLCNPLINDYHECAKGIFPVRIKTGLVFLTTAHTSEWGKVTI